MSSLVIVALPSEDDYVNKVSSEKAPHMTLLFLGDDVSKVKNLSTIVQFVEHAASQSLTRFGYEVNRRGELGPESADVLFFSKSKWSGYENIRNFRSFLLKEPNIKTAYDSVEQFPEWVPHLTLGYPATPAKEDDRDYPGINYVNFDRIAVWDKDNEGIEFPLKKHEWESEVAMDSTRKRVDTIVEDILAHVGVKGMKWGVRNTNSLATVSRSSLKRTQQLQRMHPINPKAKSVTVKTGLTSKTKTGPVPVKVQSKGKKIKTSGGHGHPAHPDAVKAHSINQVAKKSGHGALSNHELQDYTHRMNLEANAKRLNYANSNVAKKFALTLLGQTGKNQASAIANDVASAQVKKHLTGRLIRVGATAAV